MSRLRPRLNRRMFRQPEPSRSGPIIAVRRGQVQDDFEGWVNETRSEDADAFDIAWDIAAAHRNDVYGSRIHRLYADLPPGLRSRVDSMVSRITQSGRNYEAAYADSRPRRSKARRYTPRGAR